MVFQKKFLLLLDFDQVVPAGIDHNICTGRAATVDAGTWKMFVIQKSILRDASYEERNSRSLYHDRRRQNHY